MRIAIFYSALFGEGGVPNEYRGLIAALVGQKHEVIAIGRQHQTAIIPENCETFFYAASKELGTPLAVWLGQRNPDVMLLVGYRDFDLLRAFRSLRQMRGKIVLATVAQLMPGIYEGKIFLQFPEVRQLERSTSLTDRRGRLDREFQDLKSVCGKRLFDWIVGRRLLRNCDLVAVFSLAEERAVRKASGRDRSSFVRLPWGIDPMAVEDSPNFYSAALALPNERKNIVYWGRLDWHYKGLDRLLEGVRHAGQKTQGLLPFRLVLAGPDYNESLGKIRSFIAQHGLADDVVLLLPGMYPSGKKDPLRDADASVLLSRWDGFPRALRESVSLGVPIVVSPEVHFGDIVGETGCGLVVEEADSPEAVGRALFEVVSRAPASWRAGLDLAAQQLRWDAIANRFVDQLRGTQ